MEQVQTNGALAEALILNGESAECLTVVRHDGSGATPLYFVALDIGWAEHTICEQCYLADALGIAYGLAHVFDCSVLLNDQGNEDTEEAAKRVTAKLLEKRRP